MAFQFRQCGPGARGKPVLDILPVLFDGIQFWRVWWQSYELHVVILDKTHHVLGQMPSGIIDDNAELLVMFVQSFYEREILFAIGFWTEFGHHFPETECAEGARLQVWCLHILLRRT